MSKLSYNTSPIPILQQPKSEIITNPLIIPKEIEIENESDNEIKENSKTIFDMTLGEINKNISSSFLGVCEDLLNKPKEEKWNNYIFIILQKDNRYTFLILLCLFIFLFYIIVREF